MGSVKSGPLSDTGVKIFAEDATDLLRRLQDENSLVQAIFYISQWGTVLRGVLRLPVHDLLWAVKSEQESVGSALSFGLSSLTLRMYGDDWSMRRDFTFPFRLRFHSALSFAFADGSTLILFELEDERSNEDA